MKTPKTISELRPLEEATKARARKNTREYKAAWRVMLENMEDLKPDPNRVWDTRDENMPKYLRNDIDTPTQPD